jgi:DnaJ-class molecular chaperone
MRIESFEKVCMNCYGESQSLRKACKQCNGYGIINVEYYVFCNFESRSDCDWGGDCEHCPDANPILEY